MLTTHSTAAAVALMLAYGGCWANDSAQSEVAHVVTGAAIASVATAVADRYGVENRRWVGFSTCVGISLVVEGVQILTSGPEQAPHSALDFAANMLGAALGAWVTDRYLLMPVVSRDADGHRVLGLTMRTTF